MADDDGTSAAWFAEPDLIVAFGFGGEAAYTGWGQRAAVLTVSGPRGQDYGEVMHDARGPAILADPRIVYLRFLVPFESLDDVIAMLTRLRAELATLPATPPDGFPTPPASG